jgi:hypothetical protein
MHFEKTYLRPSGDDLCHVRQAQTDACETFRDWWMFDHKIAASLWSFGSSIVECAAGQRRRGTPKIASLTEP